ncbi:DUF1534 domain-containing protein [Pseudomonas tremae]|uniref:DUF1534 domain-containing protein n=1 Tax=Pseudomonas coronafaciens pv. coronafaciens TaxID=235275 RepID=A0AAE6QE23_9PSED|nr:DUF1534 domain-containing protein [Pseudomonas tremae]QGL55854.1 DUF1534 domain-containing protein [Pseudomonas coronafaciens pv. oryzae str. 1_6]QGT80704.1 DUF1534 domain-containing protein [Pseudomonas coronafaciens pv. coronafaciens]MCF5743453.1 DUF1534 domain-containing protein [Pseudomonas tremae]MCF5802230.1 DUF1534 domain-containing protein [Pseudomonas tremae]
MPLESVRWYAVSEALRHNSTARRTFRIGRRASRTASPRWSAGTIVSSLASTQPRQILRHFLFR